MTEQNKDLSNSFIREIKEIILTSRANAVRSVDFCRVQMYWQMGKRIFEEDQQGKERADYGSYLIRNLAKEIQPEFGSGFSYRQLAFCRQFYKTYPIVNAVRSQLNWTQYRLLIQMDNEDKRSFEFLGLKLQSSYYEKDLEASIITNLQEFLLEMGDGFTFVARQKRILLEDDEFFIDLVLFNRLLRSFVIIEIKTEKLTHQDLGQLQMYVNYYDRIVKLPEENPTIGILLCPLKNDAVVKMTLPSDSNLRAAEYKLYLPETKLLQQKVEEWTKEFDQK